MERIKVLIKELHRIINLIALGNVLINSIIIFMAMYLVLTFINFKPLLAVWPALLYFVLTLLHRIPNPKLDIVEAKFPHLEGKLLTAFDNEHMDNPITLELEEECITDIKRVRTSEFIDLKTFTKKLGTIFLLGILTLMISSFSFGLDDVALTIQDVLKWGGGTAAPTGQTGGLEDAEFELYAESASEAIIGTEAIAIEIPQAEIMDIDSVTDVQQRDFEETFPEALFGAGSEAYEDTLAIQHRKIVEDYFARVAT